MLKDFIPPKSTEIQILTLFKIYVIQYVKLMGNLEICSRESYSTFVLTDSVLLNPSVSSREIKFNLHDLKGILN